MPSKIKLISDDGVTFEMDRQCLLLVGTFQSLPNLNEVESLPVPSVTSPVLERLIEWLEAHRGLAKSAAKRLSPELNATEEAPSEFDEDFFVEEDITMDESPHPSSFESHVRFEELHVPVSIQPSAADRKFFESLDLGILIELTKVTAFDYTLGR